MDDGQGCPVTMHVFLKTNVTEPRQQRIGQLIEDAPGVIDVSFHSRNEGYKEFKKLYQNQPEIYETKKPRDFPARYDVTIQSGQDVGAFDRALAGSATGIDRLVPGGCVKESPGS
jgi:cell division protein FtsX